MSKGSISSDFFFCILLVIILSISIFLLCEMLDSIVDLIIDSVFVVVLVVYLLFHLGRTWPDYHWIAYLFIIDNWCFFSLDFY